MHIWHASHCLAGNIKQRSWSSLEIMAPASLGGNDPREQLGWTAQGWCDTAQAGSCPLAPPPACWPGHDTSQLTRSPLVSAGHPWRQGTTPACCILTSPGSRVAPPSHRLKASALSTKSFGFVEGLFPNVFISSKCNFQNLQDKCGNLRWKFSGTNNSGSIPGDKAHNANHCLGMFYMRWNFCFGKPKIISVAKLISLSGT